MIFVIGVLTVLLVLDCLLLILLVLVQQPKKDTGGGLAFGASATDALFGAGSGNVLTKVTKYATIAFFLLAIGVAYLQGQQYHGRASKLGKDISTQSPAFPSTAPIAPATTPVSSTTDTSSAPALSFPSASTTPAPASTNTEAPK